MATDFLNVEDGGDPFCDFACYGKEDSTCKCAKRRVINGCLNMNLIFGMLRMGYSLKS